ncbi:MAG: fructosamine kinase family protein, partial [Flavobacteriales bacterium]|nr:fructosamine kinase family protein [Flavobacteriales bacterium]
MNSHIEDIIGSNNLGKLKSVSPVSGGSINDAFRIETNSNKFFLKTNDASRFPKMFEMESKGLTILSYSSFVVPQPKVVGQQGRKQFILLDWIESENPTSNYWGDYGRSLADLHSKTSDLFGLDHSNYIGSLSQSNNWESTWADFYREERLIPQMELAAQSGQLSSKMKNGFEALFVRMEEIYPIERPSLLHGDLWSGNMMVSSEGKPCIFDPAAYYGHREMDLAMMALFGGFGKSWVGSYNEMYPLENNWNERIPIGQLYPLMVHVNLFGGSYARSVETILQ